MKIDDENIRIWIQDPDPFVRDMDRRIRILDPDPAIFVIDLQDANKKLISKKVFCLLLFEGNFNHFSKIKSQKDSQNRRNQGVFLTIFA